MKAVVYHVSLRNLKNNILLSLFLSCLISNSFSQGVIRGKVLDHQTLTPIAYVNIGIPTTSVGTLSNEDGTFSISVPIKNYSDTLIFSALGFGQRLIPVLALWDKNNLVIRLKEKATLLQPVVVTTKKEKNEIFSLGNRYTKGGFLYADSISAGAAMALLVDNKYPSFYSNLHFPIYLEEVTAYINNNTFPTFKIRVRILAYDSISGLPGKDLLTESVVITSSVKKGWIKADLRPYNLQAHQQFFIVLEWIMEDRDRLSLLNEYANYRKKFPEKVTRDSTLLDGKKIGFWSFSDFSPGTHLGVSSIPFSLQNYRCYYRTHSFDNWKRSPVILTARVLASNLLSAPNKQPSQNLPVKDPIAASDKVCHDFMSETTVNGFQLAVIKSGKVVFSKGYGYADIQKGIAVTTNTRFRIGSISKPVTAAALNELVKENKLDLDSPITNYLPPFPHFKYEVTTRQLAGHLAGVRHYKEGDIDDLVRHEHYTSATEALKIIQNDTLLFKPGENFLYSSFGWNIIGAMIEKVSGRSYLNFVEEKISVPLKLKNTSGGISDSSLTNLSNGYLATGEEFSNEDVSYKYPSGGLIATSEDLVAFGNKMLVDRKNSPITSRIFDTMHFNNGKETNYGIGWNISKDRNGHRIFFHMGNMINGSGFLILYPDDDMVVAFLSNGPEGLSFDIQKIGELFYRTDY